VQKCIQVDNVVSLIDHRQFLLLSLDTSDFRSGPRHGRSVSRPAGQAGQTLLVNEFLPNAVLRRFALELGHVAQRAVNGHPLRLLASALGGHNEVGKANETDGRTPERREVATAHSQILQRAKWVRAAPDTRCPSQAPDPFRHPGSHLSVTAQKLKKAGFGFKRGKKFFCNSALICDNAFAHLPLFCLGRSRDFRPFR
jgi:hypothetical protein